MTSRIITDAGRDVTAGGHRDSERFHTLEIFSTAFIAGTSLRITSGGHDIYAGLEADAPLNADESVLFHYIPYKVTLPKEQNGQVSKMKFEMQPFGSIIQNGIELSVFDFVEPMLTSRNKVTALYREYIGVSLSEPYRKMGSLATLSNISLTNKKLSADIQFMDFFNRAFPNTSVNVITTPTLTLFR